jgi:hypothetical protein
VDPKLIEADDRISDASVPSNGLATSCVSQNDLLQVAETGTPRVEQSFGGTE